MEPEMVEFLRKVAFSILIAVVWLGITSIAAIKGDNAFIVGSIRPGNILFYTWFVISIVLAISLLKKVWKE